MSIIDLVSHAGITLILSGWSAITGKVYLFVPLPLDGLKSPLLKKCFSDLNLYEAVKSSGLVVQLKLVFADETNS